jgi:RNA polymerase sigma-70 factor, ECF subfamily
MDNDTAQSKDKDKDAVTSIMVGQIPYLRRYARALTQNVADADDLVQNCLVRAIAKMDRFEAGTNLRAWLLAIMHNIFIDSFRKKRRAREVCETTETIQKGLFTPANQFRRVQVTDVESALSKLPAAQRSTLLLIALENLTYEEVARITEVPVGTVRSRLSRARHALIEMVDGLNTEELDRPQQAAAATPDSGGEAQQSQPARSSSSGTLSAAPEGSSSSTLVA